MSTPRSLLGRDPNSISPWALFFGYHMCVEQIRSKDPSSHDIVVLVRKGFEEADVRWNVAGMFPPPSGDCYPTRVMSWNFC